MHESREKLIKFHGTEVKNIIINFLRSQINNPSTKVIEEFNAIKSPENCETINVQVVADYVTITFYKNESSNILIRRELIPTHNIEHILIDDLRER
ncbi:MAG TPA: hypothetical protein VF222_02565 [Nitrososphaeraceae archaeon]|jgi:hypothetical protein